MDKNIKDLIRKKIEYFENENKIFDVLNKKGIERNSVTEHFVKMQMNGGFKFLEDELTKNVDVYEIEKHYFDKMVSLLGEENTKSFNIWNFPLQTKISSKEQVLQLAKEFFSQLPKEYAEKAISIIENKNQNYSFKFIEHNKEKDNNGNILSSGVMDFKDVYCESFGDLKDLYIVVHEVTHTLDLMNNNETPVRRLFGEIAPQCMERLVDDFLLHLDYEKLNKYGFNSETLKTDIQTKKITTFLNRFRCLYSLNRLENDVVVDMRYILAQYYSTQFERLSIEDKQKEIINIIENIRNNDFEKTSEAFGVVLMNKQNNNAESNIDSKNIAIEQTHSILQYLSHNIKDIYETQTNNEDLLI